MCKHVTLNKVMSFMRRAFHEKKITVARAI